MYIVSTEFDGQSLLEFDWSQMWLQFSSQTLFWFRWIIGAVETGSFDKESVSDKSGYEEYQ